jgi:dienelactone hydrolase
MHKEEFRYSDNHTTFHGQLIYDKKVSHKRPGILVVHDAWGCNDVAQGKAEQLAQMGYVALAVDMYGNGKTANTFDEAIQFVIPIMNDRALIQKRILIAYEKLLELPMVDTSKIGAIGFCFGGLTVLDLARLGVNLTGLVSFHGQLKPPENLKPQPIKAKVLALHGYDDPSVPPEQVNAFAHEMTNAKVDWQIHMYGNTVHAFTNPRANDVVNGRVYNATADHRSWLTMQNFFAEIFK